MFFDQAQRSVGMARRFGMESNDVGACLGKLRDNGVDRFNHQVNVDGGFGVGAQGLANHGAYGQVGNIMVVHDIEMYPVGAGGNNILDFFAQPGKISG